MPPRRRRQNVGGVDEWTGASFAATRAAAGRTDGNGLVGTYHNSSSDSSGDDEPPGDDEMPRDDEMPDSPELASGSADLSEPHAAYQSHRGPPDGGHGDGPAGFPAWGARSHAPFAFVSHASPLFRGPLHCSCYSLSLHSHHAAFIMF